MFYTLLELTLTLVALLCVPDRETGAGETQGGAGGVAPVLSGSTNCAFASCVDAQFLRLWGKKVAVKSGMWYNERQYIRSVAK